MSSARIPRQVPGFDLEQLDDELLLYHRGLTKAIHLNETASLIWQLCDGSRSIEEIAALLQESFPEAAAQVAGDVGSALARLVKDGAIEFNDR